MLDMRDANYLEDAIGNTDIGYAGAVDVEMRRERRRGIYYSSCLLQ